MICAFCQNFWQLGMVVEETRGGWVDVAKSHKVGFDSLRFTDQLPPNGSRGKISRPHTMSLVLLYVKSKQLVTCVALRCSLLPEGGRILVFKSCGKHLIFSGFFNHLIISLFCIDQWMDVSTNPILGLDLGFLQNFLFIFCRVSPNLIQCQRLKPQCKPS